MSVRKTHKVSSKAKPKRVNAAKKAATAEKAAVKRKKTSSVSPGKRRVAPKKTERITTKKTGAHAAKARTTKKTSGNKSAAKPETSAPRKVSPRVKAKETTKKPVKATKPSSKRATASTKARRPARRKISSLKAPVFKKGKWEDRERFPELPKEYGEDDLLLMAVDPKTVYAAWEITKDRLAGGAEDLALRVVDVAGGGKSRDIRVGERVGSGFFEIRMPGADVVAEIGILSSHGVFRPILRSPVVSFPAPPPLDEFGIISKLFESFIRAGY